MNTSDSVFDRLARDGKLAAALAFALGVAIDSEKSEAIRCLEPAHHRNGDAHKSGMTLPNVGQVKCATTGKLYGLAEILVLRGKAATAADAARMLDDFFYASPGESYVSAHGNFASESVKDGGAVAQDAFPYFPEVAADLGWERYTFRGIECMKVPTWDAAGQPGRWKIRGPRIDGKLVISFLGTAADGVCGLINAPAIRAIEDTHPLVLFVAGETDLLAVEQARRAEGIVAAVVSGSKGEGSALDELATAFVETRVIVVADADDVGRSAAQARADEIRAAGAASVKVVFPPHGKDAREFITSGGKLADLLRLAETSEVPEPTIAESVTPASGAAAEIEQAVRRPAPLAAEGYYGLAGEWWRIVEPHTEACPEAVISTFLVLAGNVIGPKASFVVGPGDEHHANEFVVVIGDSGAGKGISLKAARIPFRKIDPEWEKNCVVNASNSSAGLIYQVRDAVQGEGKDGQPLVLDPGCTDAEKRACFQLTEYGTLLRTFERQADTTSHTWRDFWDGSPTQNISRTNSARATKHHVSLIGQTTPFELLARLDSAEVFSGFANRHLAVYATRSKLLPNPEPLDEQAVQEFASKLRRAVEAAKDVGTMQRDRAATDLWTHVYPQLVHVPRGLLGALLERGRAHVVRLSMIAALLDGSSVIRVEHLLLALAVWDHTTATYASVFGDRTGDPKCDRFITELVAAGGTVLHSDLHDTLGRNWKKDDYERVVTELVRAGRIRVEIRRAERGAPGTVYVLLRAGAVPPILPLAREYLQGVA